MKNFVIVALLLLLTFCKNEVVEPEKEKPGSVTIALDKTNIPDNIVSIRVTVSRNGFEDITQELNLLSDNTAEIQIAELVAGTWHIKIEALDSNNNELYAGESEITINPGEISPLAIRLNPVADNLGGIYIYTTWDDLPFNWFDHPVNPILQKDGSQLDIYGISNSIIFYEDSSYKMWYAGVAEGGKTYIFYATSNNGLTWNKYSNQHVISPGQNSWDGTSVQTGSVIKISDTYYMYYTGFSNENSNWGIGLATSNDGINWQKKAEPILIDDTGWDYQKASTSVLYVNSKYYLFYAGKNPASNNWRIATAISSDGINFEEASQTYSFEPDQDWEGEFTEHPTVFFEDNLFKMIYHAEEGFGIAYSTDGINWTKFSNEPFFTSSKTNSNPNKISYPNIIKTENEYRLYYTGLTSSGIFYISVARKFINQ